MIRFVYGIQHLDRRALHDFVFQRRDSERSLPPVGLRGKYPTHRLRSIRSSFQPFGEILEIPLQFLPIVPPRFPVHARHSFLLQSEVGHAQRFQVVDVAQERPEPQLLILSCCLTVGLGGLGISRFPREVSAYVHGGSDRAGLWHTSRYRHTRCCLPLLPTASASRSKFLTRLNTRPARSPVNASTPPLRAAPHDSGPMWVANPLPYDFFISYTSPVLNGAQGDLVCQRL